MTPLLLLLAALSAQTPPSEGRFLEIGENDRAHGVLNAGRIERDGDRAKAVIVIAFAEATDDPGGPRVVQFLMEYDCKAGQGRRLEMAAFTDTLAPVDFRDAEDAWETYDPRTPFGRSQAHVCGGAPLKEAGAAYAPIARAFWGRVAARNTA